MAYQQRTFQWQAAEGIPSSSKWVVAIHRWKCGKEETTLVASLFSLDKTNAHKIRNKPRIPGLFLGETV